MRTTLAVIAAIFLLTVSSLAQTLSLLPTSGDRRTLANSRYTDVAGNTVTLGRTSPAAMAFVFINTECPISNKLVPELQSAFRACRQESCGVLRRAIRPDRDAAGSS